MKLCTVSIAGFRSIAKLNDLSLGFPTLLAGHNDAGKSAILDAVGFLLNEYTITDGDRTFETSVGEAGVNGDSSPRVGETWVEGNFDLSETEQEGLELPSPLRLRRVARDGGTAIYEYFASLPDEELLRGYSKLTNPLLEERIEQLGLTKSGSKKPELLKVLDDAVLSAPASDSWVDVPSQTIKALPRVQRFNPSGMADAEESIRTALQTAYRTFAGEDTFQGSIRKLETSIEERLATEADALRDHIMKRCGDIGSVKIVPSVSLMSGTGLKATQINVTSKAGEDVNLDRAGAGRARRVSLAVWEFTTGLLEDAGDVVIIYDEPDTHLDYAHQREFMKLVRTQCDLPNVRMVIATHSMNLIDGIDIADVVHIKHVDHRTVAERLGDESEVGQHLGAVAAALGLRNTVLLNERLFVGVEGATETAALPVLFRLVTGRQLESCGIALWACNNNEGAILFAEFLVSHGRQVVFLVDKDSKVNSKHVFSDAKLAGKKLVPDIHGMYVGDPNEIEDVFGNDIWVSVANAAWPRTDGKEWVESDIEAFRGDKKFSNMLCEEFRIRGKTGPSGKPDMVSALALHLTKAEQVPEQLRLIFDELVKKAA